MWGSSRAFEQVVPIILNQSLESGPGPAPTITLFSSQRNCTPESSYPLAFISIANSQESQTLLFHDNPEASEVLSGDLEPQANPKARDDKLKD